MELMLSSWKVWSTRTAPSFAVEVVSLDREPDYIGAPEAHAELGPRELPICDPIHMERRGGVRWQP